MAWCHQVAFVPGRTRWVPTTSGNIPFELPKQVWIVFLQDFVSGCACPVKDIVGILVDQIEVLFERRWDVIKNRVLICPAPLGIEVRIANNVKRRLLSDVVSFGSGMKTEKDSAESHKTHFEIRSDKAAALEPNAAA